MEYNGKPKLPQTRERVIAITFARSSNLIIVPYKHGSATWIYRFLCPSIFHPLFQRFQLLSSKMSRVLGGQIALVTGASRGVGRGIALQLGQSGVTVYISGRKPTNSLQSQHRNLPTLETTADDIRNRGGVAIPVYCDHTDHEEIAELFDRIHKENGGTLNILVNAAYSGVQDMANAGSVPFFEADPLLWDSVNNVGLRNNYICCVHAARMMVKRRSGLIVNMSSAAGLQYTFNVPYGVGKAAIDRMSADMAIELQPYGVSVVSLWPGMQSKEGSEESAMLCIGYNLYTKYLKVIGKAQFLWFFDNNLYQLDKTFEQSESAEFVGKAVVALAGDRNIQEKSGKVLMTYDLANEYNFKDIDGGLPIDIRRVSTALEYFGFNQIATIVPT
ncbi:Dehydrogenase reductase SDR member 1 [Parelaphostrongylus tenuis]|uniref:Dehydrogenase reductase SDR member 1 n=1 Tax=Parelaphostrongylus tenuis TaxID=148309 RepID=A0AAD5ML60_PARTN|nr:Dehydrogenase reductase SDR member 1 [Parelaphostrongylus tenuis]